MTDPGDDLELTKTSRKAWGALETVHVLAHFAPPVTQAYVDLGFRPRLSYFAARSAPYGAVGPEVPAATFYAFAPWLFTKTLPSSWEIASPEQVVEAQRDSIAGVMAQVLAEIDDAHVTELLGLLRTVCAGLTAPGRPLYAAYAGLPWPEDQGAALWHAATLIREHRGDGHLALLVAAELDPVEAVVLNGLYAGTMEFMRATRGWTDEEYAAGAERLAARGLVADGGLTEDGLAFRKQLERETDRLALAGWRHLGLDGTRRVLELALPVRDGALAGGMLPEWMSGGR
ncbi:SCO6745 family protein [Nocardioides campestrisoli]|uniref:SCO6745 family protein n=1 Tax=Nocardioides campestrisoli TaxID=2736757 RepID=UPI00163D664C|nr:hypothetical protein [Nocardioides campestrisoli]